jgi:hypothetical protein
MADKGQISFQNKNQSSWVPFVEMIKEEVLNKRFSGLFSRAISPFIIEQEERMHENN